VRDDIVDDFVLKDVLVVRKRRTVVKLYDPECICACACAVGFIGLVIQAGFTDEFVSAVELW